MRARLTLVALAAIVVAPAAHGASTEPRLVVHGRTGKAASELVLRHVAPAATALVVVPAGYVLALGQAPGALLGTASADQLADTGTRKLTGAVAVAPAGTAACDGIVHAATWSIALGDGTQTLATVLVAADATPAQQLLVCLAGTQVDRLTLQLAGTVLAPPTQAGHPVWEALVTLVDGSQVATVATLALPAKVTLRGTYQRFKHTIAVSGTVLEAGAAAPARRVVVSIGAQASTLTTIGATRTRPDGTWRGVITNVKRTLYVQAQVVAPELDTTATACAPPTLTAPCVSSTTAGYTATSGLLRVPVVRK